MWWSRALLSDPFGPRTRPPAAPSGVEAMRTGTYNSQVPVRSAEVRADWDRQWGRGSRRRCAGVPARTPETTPLTPGLKQHAAPLPLHRTTHPASHAGLPRLGPRPARPGRPALVWTSNGDARPARPGPNVRPCASDVMGRNRHAARPRAAAAARRELTDNRQSPLSGRGQTSNRTAE